MWEIAGPIRNLSGPQYPIHHWGATPLAVLKRWDPYMDGQGLHSLGEQNIVGIWYCHVNHDL